MGMNSSFSKAPYSFFLIAPLFLFYSFSVYAASVLDGFHPDADGLVYASALQADGKLIVGGAFLNIGGQAKAHIARLNTDGSVDTTFTGEADGDVYSIVVQDDGQILVGGAFTTIGGQTRNRIARLNSDGTAESGFDPDADNTVRAIAVLLNGDIIIGGDFATLNSTTTPLTRSHIARLAAGNGDVNPDYAPDSNAPVYALAAQRNDKVIVGGAFTTIGGATREYIARLNDDGSAETTAFNITADGAVRSIVIQADGKILIGGEFTTLTDPNGSHTRNRIALLDANGDADFNFAPNADNTVRAIVLQPDGKVLVGGDFTSIGGLSINHMARLDIEFGAADQGFTPDVDGPVYTITVQADEKILIGGDFTTLTEGTVNHSRDNLARLYTDGSVEADFAISSIVNTNDYATISSIAVQSDGKIIIAGSFSEIDGTARNNIARFNPDGTIDTSFDPDANGRVSSLAMQTDSKILVGGEFTTIGGQAIPYLARLNPDGTVDTSFTPNPNSIIHAIALQSDGRIIVGGQFLTIGGITSNNIARLFSTGSGDASYLTTSTNGPVYALVVQSDVKLLVGGSFTRIGGQSRKHIARLDTTGEVDTTTEFKNTGADNTVRAIALQADGAILVGGDFTKIDNVAKNHIARLGTDGNIDTTFAPDANGVVRSIAVQPDTNILIGGDFTTIGGQPRNYIARLSSNGVAENEILVNADAAVRVLIALSDGRILVGGDFTTIINNAGISFPRRRLARLSTVLSVDDAFSPGISGAGAYISSLTVQNDGKILVGGVFTAINGTSRSNLARLNSDGTLDTSFTADTDGAVSSIVVQADNTILVGGSFTTIGGQAIPYLAKLNADGSVDTAFTPSPDGVVYAIAVQNDGKIIVGGQFTTIGGMSRDNLARLSGTGAGDTAYTTTADGPVYALVIQPADGKLVVGGAFTNIGGQVRNYIARLSTTGAVDSTTKFKNTGANSPVRALALQADETILVGGDFTFIDAQPRNYIALLGTNGDIDPTFNPGPDNIVRSIVVQTDTKILLGGDFSTVGGQPRTYIARINSNGVVENGFIANTNAAVRTIAVQSDNKILTGGDFTTLDGQARNYIARLSVAGTVDAVFLADAADVPGATISAITMQGNGKFLVGGIFSHINGIPRRNIARLHQNGTVDATWTTTVDGEVTSILILSNGKILICGDFSSITDSNATYARHYLARLNSDGTVDQKFYPYFHGRVLAIAEETSPKNEINGDILVAGEFTTVMIPTNATGSPTNNFYQHPFLARLLNPDAPDSLTAPYPTLHTTFPAAANYPNGIIRTMAIQDDGQIIVGGDFTWIGVGVSPRSRIARISKTKGASDSTFDPNANGIVRSIVVQPDTNILVGGDFTYIGNQTRNKIARLYSDSAKADEFAPNADGAVRSIALDTDGNILAIGDFTNIGGQPRNHIARLTPILGTADNFNPGTGLGPQETISAVAVQKDGKIVVGGNFTTIDSQAKNKIARLSADNPALMELNLSTDGTKITWRRSQSSPEIHDVVFYESANNTVWTKMEAIPTRIPGGWELTVPTALLFQRQNRYIAASAKTSGGFYNGSTSSIQAVRQYFIDYYTLTITPTPTTGDVESNLAGIECGFSFAADVCSFPYQADTSLTLNATPKEYGYIAFDGQTDYIFKNWGGTGIDCGDGVTTNPVSVIMDQNRTCTANFVPAYTSLLDTDGSGTGTVGWNNGINNLAPVGRVYESGETAYVTATADANSVFTGWSGNCSGTVSPFELIMNRDKSCTATFAEARTLTITTSGTGSGTVGGDGKYALGSTATATAVADSGSKFTGWSGDCTGTSSPVNVVMDADKACNANFEVAWYLTVNTNGSGTGTVTGEGLYVDGETASVSAVPDSNSLFIGWSGDCSGTTSPVDIVMNGAKTCTATFMLKRTLSISTSGTGDGSVTGAGIYADGTTASVSAIAADGSKFMGWSGDCTGTTTPVSVLMDGDKTCDARFDAGYYNLTITTIGDGHGTVNGAGTYPEGSTVTASATADNGSVFAGWGGDCGTGTTNPIYILLDSSKNCTASFRLPILTVTFGGNGTGTVTSDDGLIVCPAGNCSQEYNLTDPPVTLTATPDEGSIFTGWAGNGINCPGTDPCTVNMDSYRDITATFMNSFNWNLFLPAITNNR